MHKAFHIDFPIKDPVLLFSVVLFIILSVPILFKKLRVPSIIGLILAGVILGPKGLNIIMLDGRIEMFGKIGLLYIMFLAGLELDFNNAVKNLNKSMVFGVYTFFIPLLVGFPIAYFLLHLPLLASVMVASMFSTHTLIAYPIASRMGVARDEAVTIAVGGTILTDTAVLLLLAALTGIAREGFSYLEFFQLFIGLGIFTAIVFLIIPWIAKWFFRNIEGEKTSHFIFVLAILFLSAFLSQLAGIEAIVGAFFAGLALNRLIPAGSTLMGRIEFVGNALFIPFFLISVGMLVDIRILFKGPEAIIFAVVMTFVANLVKWLAAWTTQLTYKLSANQRRLIWGLSNAHAAAIMAVAVTGYQMGILNENVLNGTIVLILVTCLVATFVTENAARQLVISNQNKPETSGEQKSEQFLVAVSDPLLSQSLVDLSLLMRKKDSSAPVQALAIVEDDESAEAKVRDTLRALELQMGSRINSLDEVKVQARIDLNVAHGISRSVRELNVTDVVLGWTEKVKTADMLFGSLMEQVLENNWQNIYACRLQSAPSQIKNISLVLAANAEFERGFMNILSKTVLIREKNRATLSIYAPADTLKTIKAIKMISRITAGIEFHDYKEGYDLAPLIYKNKANDLMILVSARKGTVSYHHELGNLPFKLARFFAESNFMVVYPEQSKVPIAQSIIQEADIDASSISENIHRISRLGKVFRKLFRQKD